VTEGRFSRPDRLNSTHIIDGFTCGNVEIDEWLRDHGEANDRKGFSNLFVSCDDSGLPIAGFYTLSALSIDRKKADEETQNEGPPRQIPSVLLGRLGVREDAQDEKLGASLVQDAIWRAIYVARHAAVRLLVVDAMEQGLAEWYKALGFIETSVPLRLVVLIPSLARTLDSDGYRPPWETATS
jgi:hypothetical protein